MHVQRILSKSITDQAGAAFFKKKISTSHLSYPIQKFFPRKNTLVKCLINSKDELDLNF